MMSVRASAPGSAATKSDTRTMISMPHPITGQARKSQPNGISSTPARAKGMTRNSTAGMAARLESNP